MVSILGVTPSWRNDVVVQLTKHSGQGRKALLKVMTGFPLYGKTTAQRCVEAGAWPSRRRRVETQPLPHVAGNLLVPKGTTPRHGGLGSISYIRTEQKKSRGRHWPVHEEKAMVAKWLCVALSF